MQRVVARVSPQYGQRRDGRVRRGADRRSSGRPTRPAQFLAAVPCGPDGQAADAGRDRQEPALMPAGTLAQRLLLHPAGDRAHGRARCSLLVADVLLPREAAGCWPGSRWPCLARRSLALLPFVGTPGRGVERPASPSTASRCSSRSSSCVGRGDDGPDVGALSRGRRARARASTTSSSSARRSA